MFYYKITVTIVLVALNAEARSYGPTTPDYQKCRYGRYQADLGNEELCNPWRPMCAKGYNCQGGPADQPGPCCKAVNPCKVGEPYSRDGDAPNCLKNYGLSTCPKGYTCIGTKETSSVCCKGCTYEGKTYFPSEKFYNNLGEHCTCLANGHVTCLEKVPCKYGSKTYSYGEPQFPKGDGCNVCTCLKDGTVSCTNNPCYCKYKNVKYNIGQKFGDGCKKCVCTKTGEVTCTDQYCPVPCTYGGKTYTYGEPQFPKGDGCNVCTCLKDGTVTCTNNPCYCKYKNVKYNIGQKLDDGCKKCVCTKTGEVTCTDQYCPVPCTYGGKTYTYGEPQFPKGDGCNVCTCLKDGTVSCTNNPCYCKYKNVKYNIGQKFDDGCKKCVCTKTGEVTCTDQYCPVYCHYNGQKYSSGETFPATDGCNQCTCQQTGQVTCGNKACNTYPTKVYCMYNYIRYSAGETFPSTDGCNQCTCLANRKVSCGNKTCQSYPG
ncbi:kielin/chordin-like protein isoform X4 [Saccostrea cucullata]|uniref:kielin/chordin-like protein isoform X4 n=1 Tax=Saccostrea cuccullata TaxID=36930 RepID=UPI002ED64102